MRNAIFLTLGFLELTVAIILVGFGCQLPGPAEVDEGFKRADAVIDHAGIPNCIAVGTKALRNDLQGMSGGIGVALHGFQDNSSDEVSTGITHFAIVAQSLQPDANMINAEVPTCPKVLAS